MKEDLQAKLAQLIGVFTAHVICFDPACYVEWSREQAPARVTWTARARIGGNRMRGMSQTVLLAELEVVPVDHIIEYQIRDFSREWPL